MKGSRDLKDLKCGCGAEPVAVSKEGSEASRLARRRVSGLGVGLLLGGALGLRSRPVRAGNQQYEQLSASMRSALSAAIADRSPPEPRFDSVLHKVDWLGSMSGRVPRRSMPDYRQRVDLLLALRYEAQRAGLDPQLVLGLIEVESYFRRYAVSSAGARGLMQVMPFWAGLIGDGDVAKLFDMRSNLRYGCVILRHYLDIEKGDLYRALGRYNGSLGRPEYPNLVLRAWRKWEYEPAASVRAAGPEAAAAPVPGPTTEATR